MPGRTLAPRSFVFTERSLYEWTYLCNLVEITLLKFVMPIFCSGFCIHGQKYIYCRQTGKKKTCQKKYFLARLAKLNFSHQINIQYPARNVQYPNIRYLTWTLDLSVGYWILKFQLEEFVIWNCCIIIETQLAVCKKTFFAEI